MRFWLNLIILLMCPSRKTVPWRFLRMSTGEQQPRSKRMCWPGCLKTMNVHINLDLGVTAATEAEHISLVDLKTDFMRVNTILFSLTHEMQSNLGKASRLFFLASWLGRRNDELLINFSIKKARDFSWVTANRIWNAHGSHEKESVRLSTDKAVALIGGEFRQPKGWLLRSTIRLIRRFEEKDVAEIIRILKNG